MGDDAERLGRDLADSETNYSMDQGQCGERHSDSGTVETHGAAGIFSFANECVVVLAYAVFYGGGESLPDFGEVIVLGRIRCLETNLERLLRLLFC